VATRRAEQANRVTLYKALGGGWKERNRERGPPPLGAGRGARREPARGIIDAAQKCFVEQGFHGASMAAIAETAAMSAGLMYRYFESKNAIMLAIIARELEGKRAKIEELTRMPTSPRRSREVPHVADGQRGGDERGALPRDERQGTRPRDGARDPDFGYAYRTDFERWLRRGREEGGLGLPEDVARARGVLMQCVIEGLVVRAARDPELDVAILREALEPLFRLMGFESSAPP